MNEACTQKGAISPSCACQTSPAESGLLAQYYSWLSRAGEDVCGALVFWPEEAQEKFVFFLNAFEYGTSPHVGIAFGLDSFIMLFTGAKSMCDVLAFPKMASGTDFMVGAPIEVSEAQLEVLDLRVRRTTDGR